MNKRKLLVISIIAVIALIVPIGIFALRPQPVIEGSGSVVIVHELDVKATPTQVIDTSNKGICIDNGKGLPFTRSQGDIKAMLDKFSIEAAEIVLGNEVSKYMGGKYRVDITLANGDISDIEVTAVK